MKKLFLFDIDGTLVKGYGDDRFTTTISNIHQLDIKSEKDFRGSTDQLILVDLLRTEGWGDKQIKEAMPKLLKELDKVHEETFNMDRLKLLPGVKKLLETLDDQENTLGLITGNLKSIAQRKLKALGIWSHFSVGGFGSDPHTTRSDLVRHAVKQAGFKDHIEGVYVIGDTPRDIIAAKEAGITNSVGVANGFRSTQELIDAGAKIVFKDFTDTQEVLKVLGIVAR